MGGSPRKRKNCTKKCPVDCASNPANHIPHEHLIVAASALVIVLAGIVSTITPTSAAKQPVKPRVVTETGCRDTDFGKMPEVYGSAMMVEINSAKNLVKRISLKNDTCVGQDAIREFSCRDNKTLVSQLIKCKPGTGCFKGACVATSTIPVAEVLPASSTTAVKAPSAYCVLAGITSGDFTRRQFPDIGRGYAQVAKSGITSFAQLTANCTAADFAALETAYCAVPNQPMYSFNAVTYDAAGNFTTFGGCHDMQGCDYRFCQKSPADKAAESAAALTAPGTSRQAVPGCADTDGGENGDMAGTVFGTDGKTYQDICSNDSTLTEYYCNPSAKSTNVISSAINCESGICSNGACVTETSE